MASKSDLYYIGIRSEATSNFVLIAGFHAPDLAAAEIHAAEQAYEDHRSGYWLKNADDDEANFVRSLDWSPEAPGFHVPPLDDDDDDDAYAAGAELYPQRRTLW